MDHNDTKELAVEIARVRNILRKSVQRGRWLPETSWAMERLLELAQQGSDSALRFEYKRWSVHLESLERAPVAEPVSAAGSWG